MATDHFTRREFLLTSAAIWASRDGIGLAQAKEPDNRFLATPGGDLAYRIELTRRRLLEGDVPRFTREFILADVTLDPLRRFTNFSGDTSGRYIGALAMASPKDAGKQLAPLVDELIRHQKSDGRFGDERLKFTADEIGKEHMALLWGNGRLLVGLLEYHSVSRNRAVLDASVRLGDFLVAVRRQCAEPEVARRVAGQGAHGFICFTQLIEGLVMLAHAAGEKKYLATAREIMPLLPARGIEHSHGWLSTLRGGVMLYEATGDDAVLRFTEEKFRELLASPDYTLWGSVYEYFGWDDKRYTDADRRNIVSPTTGRNPRDEGCSHADFLRLALQLWRVTGKLEYLDIGERCLLNGFYFNQFETGDFGHRVSFARGFKPTESVGRAWWCCTMHGLRAFPDLLDAAATGDDRIMRINLFVDGRWENERIALRTTANPEQRQEFVVIVEKGTAEAIELAIRQPGWSAETRLSLNGTPVEARRENGYLLVNRAWRKGDRLLVNFRYREQFRARDGRLLSRADFGDRPIEAALYYGPYLMGVDDTRAPLFFGEPWPANVIHLPPTATGSSLDLPFSYTHEGFRGTHPITLRPVAQRIIPANGTVAVWLNYRRA